MNRLFLALYVGARLLPLDLWLPLALCLVVIAYTHTVQFSGCNADPGTGVLVIVCVQP